MPERRTPVALARAAGAERMLADLALARRDWDAAASHKETGRMGTVREVLETRGRKLYYVVHDRTSREEAVPLAGEPAAEFGTYTTADTFEVLP